MADEKPEKVGMLKTLIENAVAKKKVDLRAKPTGEVVKLEREGQDVETVILSMEYSGTIETSPFKFKKSYSFTHDETEFALQCLLIANNRLQTDYNRLKKAGISVKEEFFNFQNSFIGLQGDASMKRPTMRLQDFIHLSRAGVPVSVDVTLKRPAITLKQEDVEKKGFGCLASFVFTTGEEKTTIEKLYGLGSYDDPERYQAETREIANRRLERDYERLSHAGMKIDKLSF